MLNAQEIKEKLEDKFVYLKDTVKVQRAKRVWLEVAYPNFTEVFTFAINGLDFPGISAITGFDEGENLGFIYHLSGRDGTMLNIKTAVNKEKGTIRSITSFFPGAAIYERELIDLFGAKVEGLPDGIHYPLPDDWPAGQYPLRKDWDQSVLDKVNKE